MGNGDQAEPRAANAQGNKTVYVGNLSWDTRWQGLKDVSYSALLKVYVVSCFRSSNGSKC